MTTPKASDVLNMLIAKTVVAPEYRMDSTNRARAAHQMHQDILSLIGDDNTRPDNMHLQPPENQRKPRENLWLLNLVKAELRTKLADYFNQEGK